MARNIFKRIVGWELYGSEWFLRLDLEKPQMRMVWPGTVLPDRPPENELRRLTDTLMTRTEILKAISDPMTAVECGYSREDLEMLGEGLRAFPVKDGARTRKQLERPGVSVGSAPRPF